MSSPLYLSVWNTTGAVDSLVARVNEPEKRIEKEQADSDEKLGSFREFHVTRLGAVTGLGTLFLPGFVVISFLPETRGR